jgi:uncharacterized membrane protein
MKTKLEKAFLDSMSSNPNNWKGIIYFNPGDPRLLVRKIHPSMGWTFNFAHAWSYVALISMILIAIATVLFL